MRYIEKGYSAQDGTRSLTEMGVQPDAEQRDPDALEHSRESERQSGDQRKGSEKAAERQ